MAEGKCEYPAQVVRHDSCNRVFFADRGLSARHEYQERGSERGCPYKARAGVKGLWLHWEQYFSVTELERSAERKQELCDNSLRPGRANWQRLVALGGV